MGGHRANGPARGTTNTEVVMHEQDRTPLRVRVERGIYKRTTKDGKTTRYEVAFVDGDGRQRWRTVGKIQDARRLRADLVSKVDRGEVVPSSKKTFAELAEEWYAAKAPRVRRRTAEYYRQALDHVLLPRFGPCRVAAITPTRSRS
jgi:Phage integrase, N-terminal SAM-like domain